MVYRAIGKPCVENIFNGLNCSLFAYGQTGTGKSHTLVGELKDPKMHGLLPRACQAIMDLDCEKVVSCYMIELYNDEIHDLLVHPHTGPDGKKSRPDKARAAQRSEAWYL